MLTAPQKKLLDRGFEADVVQPLRQLKLAADKQKQIYTFLFDMFPKHNDAILQYGNADAEAQYQTVMMALVDDTDPRVLPILQNFQAKILKRLLVEGEDVYALMPHRGEEFHKGDIRAYLFGKIKYLLGYDIVLNIAQLKRIEEVLENTYFSLLQDIDVEAVLCFYECLQALMGNHRDEMLTTHQAKLEQAQLTGLVEAFQTHIVEGMFDCGEDKFGIASMNQGERVVGMRAVKQHIQTLIDARVAGAELAKRTLADKTASDEAAKAAASEKEASIQVAKSAIERLSLATAQAGKASAVLDREIKAKLYMLDDETVVFPTAILLMNRKQRQTPYQINIAVVGDGDYEASKHPAYALMQQYPIVREQYRQHFAEQQYHMQANPNFMLIAGADSEIDDMQKQFMQHADFVVFYSHGAAFAESAKRVQANLKLQRKDSLQGYMFNPMTEHSYAPGATYVPLMQFDCNSGQAPMRQNHLTKPEGKSLQRFEMDFAANLISLLHYAEQYFNERQPAARATNGLTAMRSATRRTPAAPGRNLWDRLLPGRSSAMSAPRGGQ